MQATSVLRPSLTTWAFVNQGRQIFDVIKRGYFEGMMPDSAVITSHTCFLHPGTHILATPVKVTECETH
jgi:hypothetical protein